ncbi:MAG: Flp pilus assembly complex ATPase component TadA [Candidatus Omnitrophica bacterium]|nr:Flp pilus assembly complex ATPase component TadA [Candidatus Omnitrophota bacterium]
MKSDGGTPSPPLRRKVLLGELLVSRGLLTGEQLSAALAKQAETGDYLGAILIRMGVVTEAQFMQVLADQLGIAFIPLAATPIHPEVLAKVPAKVATRYQLIPVKLSNNVLSIAIADPFDVQALDELRLLLNCSVTPLLASPRDIQEAIHRHYGVGASAVERLLDRGGHEATERTRVTEDLTAASEEASVISFVNQLILSAVNDRATDIHIEPFDQALRIRQRVDGVMYDMPIPADVGKLHQAIVSRIKVMAQLDIAERRLPQDGRIKVRLEEQELDLRISVLPTNFGETVEVRILSNQMLFSLKELGLTDEQLDRLLQLIQRPHGIIFVTGPTGSGKSTTLYACLSKLNAPNVKILTIEDPIEYQLTGITQLQVHPKIGFTFAQGLRSMLRHDPDIMMVGEVRDPETAEITIRSALTGHLVFSTLHTNDAAGGVTRLLDMGVEPYLVASSVLCFIAQRLVRVICSACAEDRRPPPGLREEFGVSDVPDTLRYGRGCAVCKGTGYKGRTAIHEFLVVTEDIQQVILKRASSHDIARLALRGGMRPLRQDGWDKIVQRVTTPEEVLRVT